MVIPHVNNIGTSLVGQRSTNKDVLAPHANPADCVEGAHVHSGITALPESPPLHIHVFDYDLRTEAESRSRRGHGPSSTYTTGLCLIYCRASCRSLFRSMYGLLISSGFVLSKSCQMPGCHTGKERIYKRIARTYSSLQICKFNELR